MEGGKKEGGRKEFRRQGRHFDPSIIQSSKGKKH